ncbi:MAG: Fic family protein [Negativicoccus succinicivorans]|uniref:Fido domain-containing protein n=4 Tax=root TaxID=1 RepID=W1WRK8_9ZZZZ|nr:Fic family protein [Negativicoccus succinicivorans]MBS5917932.1 Fic family protein [Negativicoccus succinicivorans]MDU5288782.1 Fic family protein [Negativicoccus succinicivorans]
MTHSFTYNDFVWSFVFFHRFFKFLRKGIEAFIFAVIKICFRKVGKISHSSVKHIFRQIFIAFCNFPCRFKICGFNYYVNERQMTLQDMAEFHLEFETIHPFQDGNGRIGRFLLLKQCLACNRDPICIHSESAQAYRNALQLSRVEKNIEPLAEVFQSAQKNFNVEFPLLYDIRKNYEQEVRDIIASVKTSRQERTPERGI